MEFAAGLATGILGLGKSKTVSKQDIKNTIQSAVDNTNTQLMTTINQSMTSISTNVINNQEASINNSNTAGSVSTIKNISVSNGGTLDINQQSKLISKANAILSITQDTTMLNKMTQDIINDVASKISQNTNLSENLKATNALEKSKEIDGEVNNLVDKVAETAQSLLEHGKDKMDETSITNAITNTIKNSTYFENNFTNILNNILNTTISSNLLNHCLSSSTSFNNFDIGTITIEGAGSSVHLTQESLLDNFFGCYITSLVKTGVYQELAQSMYNKSSQAVDTTNAVSSTMDTQNTIKNIEKTTSIITALLQTLMYVIGGIIIFIIVIFIAFPGLKFLKNPISNLLSKIKKAPIVKTASALNTIAAASKYYN
jgi:hypothetical protein